MEPIKLANGTLGHSEAEVAKSATNLTNHAGDVASIVPLSLTNDRFVRSSDRTEEGNHEIVDTVTFTSVQPDGLAREAKVAGVKAAIQNGTYHLDAKAVASAIIAKMLKSGDDPV